MQFSLYCTLLADAYLIVFTRCYFFPPISSHPLKLTMLFEKYFKINKCNESHVMFTPRKQSNSSLQQAMQVFLTSRFSLNTCPVTLPAAELLLLFHCLGEGSRIIFPYPSSAQDPKLTPCLPYMKKEASDSMLSVIRLTLYMHTTLLFAVHIKVFFILWRSFPFMTQSTTTAILHKVSLFA